MPFDKALVVYDEYQLILSFSRFPQTLAKVVGGWKVHEANLVKTIGDYATEKEKNTQEMVKLKEVCLFTYQ